MLITFILSICINLLECTNERSFIIIKQKKCFYNKMTKSKVILLGISRDYRPYCQTVNSCLLLFTLEKLLMSDCYKVF